MKVSDPAEGGRLSGITCFIPLGWCSTFSTVKTRPWQKGKEWESRDFSYWISIPARWWKCVRCGRNSRWLIRRPESRWSTMRSRPSSPKNTSIPADQSTWKRCTWTPKRRSPNPRWESTLPSPQQPSSTPSYGSIRCWLPVIKTNHQYIWSKNIRFIHNYSIRLPFDVIESKHDRIRRIGIDSKINFIGQRSDRLQGFVFGRSIFQWQVIESSPGTLK